MEEYQLLKKFAHTPVTHQTLLRELVDYNRPNDKISSWINKGVLTPLSRGIYVISKELFGVSPEKVVVANILYGPSYISLEYALSYYGAIPERVEEVTSVTNMRSTIKKTILGVFSYTHIPQKWFSKGIRNIKTDSGQYFYIGTPEKVLCDTVICSKKLLFRSQKDAFNWLNDMRIDDDYILSLDLKELENQIDIAPKSESLKLLFNAILSYDK